MNASIILQSLKSAFILYLKWLFEFRQCLLASTFESAAISRALALHLVRAHEIATSK